MVGGSLEFIFHKGVAAQLYQLGWRNKWPLHTWGCRLYTLSDKYKKTFYLQLRVCVSYLDVSSNEIFLASLGCLHTNNSFHSYMIVSFTIFCIHPIIDCSFEISLTKVLLLSKGLESYLLHSGVHSLQLSSCLCSISLC